MPGCFLDVAKFKSRSGHKREDRVKASPESDDSQFHWCCIAAPQLWFSQGVTKAARRNKSLIKQAPGFCLPWHQKRCASGCSKNQGLEQRTTPRNQTEKSAMCTSSIRKKRTCCASHACSLDCDTSEKRACCVDNHKYLIENYRVWGDLITVQSLRTLADPAQKSKTATVQYKCSTRSTL